MRVRVLLPFLLNGQATIKGAEVDLDEAAARDLIARRRVCALEQAPAAVGPLSTTSSPALVKGKGKKEQ